MTTTTKKPAWKLQRSKRPKGWYFQAAYSGPQGRTAIRLGSLSGDEAAAASANINPMPSPDLIDLDPIRRNTCQARAGGHIASRKNRRKYSTEFKSEAVKLTLESGLTQAQAARDLGVAESVLGRWVRAVEDQASPGALTTEKKRELQGLRRENSIKQRPYSRRRSCSDLQVHPRGEGHLPGPHSRPHPPQRPRLAIRQRQVSSRPDDDGSGALRSRLGRLVPEPTATMCQR